MFINPKQYKILREKAQSGDNQASDILNAHYKAELSDNDISDMIEKYFNPPVQDSSNEIDSETSEQDNVNPDNVEYVSANDNVGENEFEQGGLIGELVADELEAISGYNKAELQIIADNTIKDSIKSGLLSDIAKIKAQELEHIETLKKYLK